jgi:hypothetical protein
VPAGLTAFHTRVDATATLGVFVDITASFNPNTGQATWTFTSLDPTTLDLPMDPTVGFLPPNKTAPDGQGFVTYTVNPKPGLTTGTKIGAAATVVFDTDPAEVTAPQSNTIDAGAPTSSVKPLPAFSPANFTVSWSGQDDPGGSGIGGSQIPFSGYDVYVSDNGGPATLLLQTPSQTAPTLQTSTSFTGVNGHTYGFYVVAIDNVGNRQAMPAAFQATTRVDTLPPTSSVQPLPATSPANFTVSWSGTDDPGGSGIATYDVYVSDNGGPFTPFLTGTSQTSATFTGQVGHTYGFYSAATDAAGNRQTTPAGAQTTTTVGRRVFVTGADAGGGPDVVVFDAATHQLLSSFFAYDPRFTGGVRVALGDVNGDGFPDLITMAGPGGGPQVNVYDGKDAALGLVPHLLFSFFAFSPQFTGGAWIAAGDVNGDGYADIICGADKGGGPNITVYSGKALSSGATAVQARLSSFFAYDPHFTGGVRVAAGDVNGDGYADIIAGAGPGGGPNVTVFSGKDGRRLMSFFAFAPTLTAGIFVGSADVNNDGHADIICGAGPGGGPDVTVFNGLDGAMLSSFFAFDPRFTGGVRVAGVTRGSGQQAVLAVAGLGGGPDVRIFAGALKPEQVDQFFAGDPRFTGGLYVAG